MSYFGRVVTVCSCTHQKRHHDITKQRPAGPCFLCSCPAFTPERICKCGHGEKAHSKGPCHEADGCKQFRPIS